jgi:alcohol dehydrogenase, propanol-preferring
MKAAVVQEFGQPLVLEDVPMPVPASGQVVVKVETSGLCHTDIHAAHGDWPIKPTLPLIPGHEGVGIVTRVGADVTRLREGDRVAVPWLGWACGACEACASGWETLCPHAKYTGYSVHGAFAEYVLADALFAGRVPDAVDPLDAAPLTCAGVTTYKAVKVSGARSSDLIAIYGVGGLGHLAMQYAQIAGATVAAVDVADFKLALPKNWERATRSTRAKKTLYEGSRRSGEPMRRSCSRRARRRASRRSRASMRMARSSSSHFRRTTRCGCRSSKPC